MNTGLSAAIEAAALRVAAERERLERQHRALTALLDVVREGGGDVLSALALVMAPNATKARQCPAFARPPAVRRTPPPVPELPADATIAPDFLPEANGHAPPQPRKNATKARERQRDARASSFARPRQQRQSGGQDRIRALLADGIARTVPEVAAGTGQTTKQADANLRRMLAAGVLVRAGEGRKAPWTLAESRGEGRGARGEGVPVPALAPDDDEPESNASASRPPRANGVATKPQRLEASRLQAARHLRTSGPQRAAQIAAATGARLAAVLTILVHDWFEEERDGRWTLSSAGWSAVTDRMPAGGMS